MANWGLASAHRHACPHTAEDHVLEWHSCCEFMLALLLHENLVFEETAIVQAKTAVH